MWDQCQIKLDSKGDLHQEALPEKLTGGALGGRKNSQEALWPEMSENVHEIKSIKLFKRKSSLPKDEVQVLDGVGTKWGGLSCSLSSGRGHTH